MQQLFGRPNKTFSEIIGYLQIFMSNSLDKVIWNLYYCIITVAIKGI